MLISGRFLPAVPDYGWSILNRISMNYERVCNHCGKEIFALRGDRCPHCRGIIGETQKEAKGRLEKEAKARLENTKDMQKSTRRGSSKFEEWLFSGIRFTAIFMAVAALIGLLFTIFGLFYPSDTQVELKEISSKASVSPKSYVSYEKPLTYTKLVRKYIPEGGENDSLLISWLSKLEVDQRQDFINNLSDIIYQAEREKLDVEESISAYKELKFKKIANNNPTGYDKIKNDARDTFIIFSSIICLFFVGLILVLLAIERHLRPPLLIVDSEEAVF